MNFRPIRQLVDSSTHVKVKRDWSKWEIFLPRKSFYTPGNLRQFFFTVWTRKRYVVYARIFNEYLECLPNKCRTVNETAGKISYREFTGVKQVQLWVWTCKTQERLITWLFGDAFEILYCDGRSPFRRKRTVVYICCCVMLSCDFVKFAWLCRKCRFRGSI